MTAMLRRILSTFAIAVGFALPASATTFSVDYTDLWYVPAEDGWGINLIQHNATTQELIMRVNFFSSGGVASTCNFNGTYGQNGKQGNFTGSWGCTIGGSAYNSGTFTMTELTNTLRGINARFQGTDNLGCQY